MRQRGFARTDELGARARLVYQVEIQWGMTPGGFGALPRRQQARLLGYVRADHQRRHRERMKERAKQLAAEASKGRR